MDETPQCQHWGGANKYAKRQCTRPATKGDYCTMHARHPDRRNERALALIWEHRSERAGKLLEELADIGMDSQASTGDRIRASVAYLDRTGHGPTSNIPPDDAQRIAQATIDLLKEENGGGDGD